MLLSVSVELQEVMLFQSGNVPSSSEIRGAARKANLRIPLNAVAETFLIYLVCFFLSCFMTL